MDLLPSLTVPLPISTAVPNLRQITTTLPTTTLRLATTTLLLSTITLRPGSLNLNIIKEEDTINRSTLKIRLTVTLEGSLLKTNSVDLLPSNTTEEEEEEDTLVNSSNIIRIKEVSNNNKETTKIKVDIRTKAVTNKVEEEGDTEEEDHLTIEQSREESL